MTLDADRTIPALGRRCSDLTRQRGDQLAATAPTTTGWLLIEEAGGWGRDALTESAIDPEVAATLADRARQAGVRVQLIRRCGNRRTRPQQRAVAVVNSQPGAERVSWHTVHADRELLDLPLDGSAGVVTAEPVYLVCTHGVRDVCCAVRGRPVAEHLTRHRPEHTWETNHVGGHRYAANLVVLPHGLYYGQVTEDTALTVAELYEKGEVLPAQFRGRSGHSTPVQAAECFARMELGEPRLDALVAGGPVALGLDTWQVPLDCYGSTVTVTVRSVDAATPALMSCRDAEPKPFQSFELVSLTTT